MRSICIFQLTFGVILLLSSQVRSDDSPGFFLKITKNIPRLGRRADREFGTYFMKNIKAIPRIGRSEQNAELEKFLEDSKSPLNKRLVPPSSMHMQGEYSVVQPVNSGTLIDLLSKDAIPSDNVKFVHWKDFDRALQMDDDLYAKVISLGRRPDQSLKQDLSIGGYVPLLGSSNDVNSDYMFFNKGHNDLYGGHFDRDYLQYNNVKK